MAEPHIEVANDFFHDAGDLLHRYRLTVDHFYSVKSKRMKLFLDLRIAAECILKAYAAYFLMASLSREEVIRKVEAYGHNIKKLALDVESSVMPDLWELFSPFVPQLAELPVGLRYRLDGADFRVLNEDFYYQTIGSDDWLDNLHENIDNIRNSLNFLLSEHSKILSGKELLVEVMKSRCNKYERHKDKNA